MSSRWTDLLSGTTPVIAVLFVPVPAYVLWLHFQNYSGPVAVLLLPAALAFLAGYTDRYRTPFQIATILASATYAVIVVDTFLSIRELSWMALLVIPYAALWVIVTMGLPAFACVLLGRGVHALRARS